MRIVKPAMPTLPPQRDTHVEAFIAATTERTLHVQVIARRRGSMRHELDTMTAQELLPNKFSHRAPLADHAAAPCVGLHPPYGTSGFCRPPNHAPQSRTGRPYASAPGGGASVPSAH